MVEFKEYLHGVSDAASRLMSGTHGLNGGVRLISRKGRDEGVPVV